MAEIVLERYQRNPGEPVEEFEIPGPGLYEADFQVPDWLIPDGTIARDLKIDRGEYTLRHIHTRSAGSTLTVRFEVIQKVNAAMIPNETAALTVLTVAVVARAIFAVTLGALAVLVIKGIVDGMRELRKLGESKAGVGLGVGIALAGAALLLSASKQ